ncbi:30S ribosomal protein S16 [Candidatus Dojkabacteria bacterium]|uniref:Small ribosomal subunit protein bS16 n=1 Tax=Candidatus Dojkabacteria bacterium TaxID=2099670 RepID=A0A3M0Z068_9BACT|nr:MAG: 30S ribosomal protein S16 [Candidatus Dojkabacteria bacterium]
MVKIRLSRVGRKNLPSYKIVVTDARRKRESNFIECLGSYSPITKNLVIDEDRAKYWIGVGARPTDTVKALLIKKQIIVVGSGEAEKK